MKTLKVLVCLSFLFFAPLFVIEQSWDWASSGYGPLKSDNNGAPVAVDRNGNAYITGQYLPSISFGSYTLKDSTDNAYIAKYNSAGKVIWAVQPTDSGTGAASSCYGISIATDGPGNVLICGMIQGVVKFGAFRLGNHPENVFVAKYSTGGNALWARQANLITPSSLASGNSVTTDKYGNVFITGYFGQQVSFGKDTLTNNSTPTAFLVKYDSTGNVVWARQSVLPSLASSGYAWSVITDNTGNIYLTGNFEDSITFGGLTLTNYYSAAVFLVKYNPVGKVIWARQSVSVNTNSSGTGTAVAVDKENHPYVTGYFSDSISFGANLLYAPSNGALLVKYDSNGNVLWAKQSSSGWLGRALSADKAQHIYLGGVGFSNNDSLNFGNYTLHTKFSIANVAFIMQFDTSGNPECGSLLENLDPSFARVAADSSGNYLYLGGTFSDTVICANDTLVPTHGGKSVFLGRWQSCDNADQGISKITPQNSHVFLYPNPSNGNFTIQANSQQSAGADYIEIYNMLGEKVYFNYQITKSFNYQIDLSRQPNGIYLYRVTDESGNLIGNGKFIIQK